ncbi:hypothetical protein GUITHDRAFT_109575 [Guillardia theta CCMP2712]|uniref:SAP domain-containing protein n=1 Tax=Guillardia theta (strain CCMP2712) TaxID=905079 RepID=L1J7Z7_GUITC|nr:hypothetical protein GUITHDRAFT_109575 [Guillardia theta CCMP2712]EKX44452.1 hypothetical protein GUITHDRAFT_109575 [Guillardia theta CCMP2712]|eukprot:XP_005831432.1 hypothetical protein GUITHDRAFT_109575 [Guillardia theta CCMP2712]
MPLCPFPGINTSLLSASSSNSLRQGVRTFTATAARCFANSALSKDLGELGDLKKTEMQERLKALGAKTTGNKDELLSRLKGLMDNMETSALKKKAKDALKKRVEEEEAAATDLIATKAVQPAKKSRKKASKKDADEHLIQNPHLIPPEEFENYKNVFSRAAKKDRKKDADSLYYATRNRPMISRRLVRNLYKRCVRSAQRCPQAPWRKTMHDYVRMKFRERSNDDLMVRLTAGEIELKEMEYYHSCREKREAEKAAMEGGEVKEKKGRGKGKNGAKLMKEEEVKETEEVQEDLD